MRVISILEKVDSSVNTINFNDINKEVPTESYLLITTENKYSQFPLAVHLVEKSRRSLTKLLVCSDIVRARSIAKSFTDEINNSMPWTPSEEAERGL